MGYGGDSLGWYAVIGYFIFVPNNSVYRHSILKDPAYLIPFQQMLGQSQISKIL